MQIEEDIKSIHANDMRFNLDISNNIINQSVLYSEASSVSRINANTPILPSIVIPNLLLVKKRAKIERKI